ncbi:helix-turn-helix transcriptional regulator [Acinetobacter venetianus]|uniref:helix-turn-helix transcriptional regulator n=1 Tax=Acinetobacter venetianus TaxID=52133 RepID=UPI000778877B|nr:helix-turn-helix transcriptional regulator [Acinetobacter venetianus]KXZ65077.1 Bacterial regulatory protein, luxR family [Acinetobacter venetianus]
MSQSTLNQYYEELIDLIYKILDTPENWVHFGQRLTRILDATYIQVQALDVCNQAISFSAGGGRLNDIDRVASDLAYLHYPVDSDPRWEYFLQLSLEDQHKWYQCHHHIDHAFVEQSKLYQQVLLPFDLRYVAVKALVLDEQLCIAFIIHTSEKQQPLQNEKINFLNRLLPHLERVLKTQRQLYKFSTDSIVGYSLINKLHQPIVLLNLSGGVVHYNTAVSTLLEKTNLIQLQNNQIYLDQPYQQQLKDNLREIEALFRQQTFDNELLQDGGIKIQSESGETLYIFASLLATEQELKAFGIRPLVMLTLFHPEHSISVDIQLLSSVFKFTPAECKVALSLLDGFSTKEIAQKNKVRADTIKKQIQSIYRKTSTHKQSELVKILLNFPKAI